MFLAPNFFWGGGEPPGIFGLSLSNPTSFRSCGKVSGRSVEGARREPGEIKKTSRAFYKSSRTTVTGGLKRMFQMASFWPQICINQFSAGAKPRTPLGELTTLPQTPSRMVRGHSSSPWFSLDAFGISISAHTEWGCDRARDNDFPGPAVAIDGPVQRSGSVTDYLKSSEFRVVVLWQL